MALSSPKSATPFVPPSLSSSAVDERNWNASAAITEFYRSPMHSTTASRDGQKNPAPRPPLAKALTPGARPTQSFNGRSRGMFQVRTLDAERDTRDWEGDAEMRSSGGMEERSGRGGAAERSGRELGRCGSERTAADRAGGNEFSFSTSSSFRETVSLSTDAPSRRNEFSRRDDSIGSATGIYAHAHTFTSANPPLSSSGPRSASLERSPESYGVKSAVSNADMYAFCPLAVASSTPGRRPPRRGIGGSGSFSGRHARSPSPQRAAAPAPPVEPLRLGPLIAAIGQADVTAIRDAVKAVRAAIKATPENKKRLIQAGGVQFLINLVAESPDGDTVEHAVTVLYNVCREEGGRDAIVSGAEGGLEALVKALRAEKSAARENAAAALFCLAWGIQTASGGGKGGRGSRGPSPSRPTRGRSTSVGAISTSPAVSARSSPHTPSLPPSPSLKSPTASTALLRSPYDSREFSGVFSGAGNSPSQPEGSAQAAAGVNDVTSGAGEAATGPAEAAAATARTEATPGAADATAGESNEDLENRAMALVSFIACSSMGRRAIKEAKSANGNGGLEVIADVLDLTTSQKARQEAVSALLLLARHDEEARRVISREGVVPALHRVTREAKGSAGDKAKELLVLLRELSASGQLQAAA
ncbi:unnamed protein product [Closterium sp. Yama58-4]|nr:unnamed protein product [Closterium sp. Yama58-4]